MKGGGEGAVREKGCCPNRRKEAGQGDTGFQRGESGGGKEVWQEELFRGKETDGGITKVPGAGEKGGGGGETLLKIGPDPARHEKEVPKKTRRQPKI